MASNSKHRSSLSINSTPVMLKDFLLQDDSASGDANSPNLNYASRALGVGPPPANPRRSRSRSAAEAAISALQRLFASPKKKQPSSKENELVQVPVKDIQRWRSLRDLIDDLDYEKEEDEAPPLDCLSASANGRSRLDEGPSREWVGGKGNVGGADPMMAGTRTTTLCCSSDYVGPSKDEHEVSNNDEEQHSPVSVLDSPFRDDEDSAASFDQSLANVERTKQSLLESIKRLEALAGVDSTDSDEEGETDSLVEEQTTEARPRTHSRYRDEKLEVRVTKEAKAIVGYKKEPELEECVRETEKGVEWGRYEEQTNELGSELGLGMLDSLVDEVVIDLIGRCN